jgi:hypothetical protein
MENKKSCVLNRQVSEEKFREVLRMVKENAKCGIEV